MYTIVDIFSFLTLTWVPVNLGNPLINTPTSVEVPPKNFYDIFLLQFFVPISTTIASLTPDIKAAPLILFVGPEENVITGCSMAYSNLKSYGWSRDRFKFHVYIFFKDLSGYQLVCFSSVKNKYSIYFKRLCFWERK